MPVEPDPWWTRLWRTFSRWWRRLRWRGRHPIAPPDKKVEAYHEVAKSIQDSHNPIHSHVFQEGARVYCEGGQGPIRLTLVRHGQSRANIGESFDDHTQIPLTDLGHEQARKIGDSWSRRPSHILRSPFLRTHQTAEPTISRFPTIPVDILPMEEFTYLSPDLLKGSSWQERKPDVRAYWDALDPDLVHGTGAESFSMLIGRVRTVLARVEQEGRPWSVAFTHGQFMQAVRVVVENPGEPLVVLMERLFLARLPDNTECYDLEFHEGRWSIVPDTPSSSPFCCEHANEVPCDCRCTSDCYCKAYTCRLRP